MTHLRSVLIRSTTGWFEPRFHAAEKYIKELPGSASSITWSRTVNDELVTPNGVDNTFKIKADYGRGWKNVVHHAAFFFFVVRRLHAIKPSLIYACDLDTLLPSLIWRFNKNCLIVYDQFDPLSARTRNRILRLLLDKVEYRLADMSDLQITANKLRIPRKLRGSWFELKNLFPIKPTAASTKSNSSFILFYGGILALDRGLLACAEAVSMEQEWEFHLYGQGEFSKTLALRNFKNVFVHEPVPHEELMSIASRSHLLLAMYDPRLSHNRLTASNKLFEAAQLGIPILTNGGTSIGFRTLENSLGWCINYNNHEEIRNVLQEVSKISSHARNNYTENLKTFYLSEKKERDLELDKIRVRVNAFLGGDV